jgi:hypothetical protein
MLQPPTHIDSTLCSVQWAKAQIDRGKKAPIVVLADLPKNQLDELVDAARAETGLDMMGRSGLPYNLDDLEMVNATEAKTIIVMDPKHHLHFDVCPLSMGSWCA